MIKDESAAKRTTGQMRISQMRDFSHVDTTADAYWKSEPKKKKKGPTLLIM